MKKWIINITVLILVAAGSFFLGAIILGPKFVPKSDVLLGEIQEGDLSDEESGDLPLIVQKGMIASFFLPDIDTDRGIQKSLTQKLAEISNVWDVIKTSSSIINFIQSAHPESRDSLIPINNTMEKMSGSLFWIYSAIGFIKYLLLISSRIILIIVIPVFIIISVISILTNKGRIKTYKLIIKTILVTLIILFTIPVSLQLSIFAEKAILSDNINNLVTSIEEKGEIALEMENEIADTRRQNSPVISYMENTKELSNALIQDIMNYRIIFIFTYIIFPVLIIFGIIILTRFFVKNILSR